MEGEPVTVGNTVTRSIYVLDGSSNTRGVLLNVFKKTDIVTDNGDTVSITPSKKLTLPLAGGSNALCTMAANDGFIFVGTDASPNAVRVNKLTYSLTKLGGFSPPLPVTAITANDYGYVTVTQEAATQGSGFSVYGPNGMLQEDGGGARFHPQYHECVPALVDTVGRRRQKPGGIETGSCATWTEGSNPSPSSARLGQPDGISPSRMAEMLEVDKAGPIVRC
jgi:hypothetical protein